MRLEKRLERLERSVQASSPQADAMNEFLELAGAFNWNRDEPQGPRVVGVAQGTQWWDRRRWETEKEALWRSLPGAPDPQTVTGCPGIVVKTLGAGTSLDDL